MQHLQINGARTILETRVKKLNCFLQIWPIQTPGEDGPTWSINPLVQDLNVPVEVSFKVAIDTFVTNTGAMTITESNDARSFSFSAKGYAKELPATLGGLPCYFVEIDFETDILVKKNEKIFVVDSETLPPNNDQQYPNIQYLGEFV